MTERRELADLVAEVLVSDLSASVRDDASEGALMDADSLEVAERLGGPTEWSAVRPAGPS